MISYLRLVRWPNLLILGLIILLVKTQLVDVFSAGTAVPSCISMLQWFLLAAATIFIAASGNVVNDIFDQEIDRFNKPDTRIVGAIVSEASAWNLYYALSSIGLLSGIYLCYSMGNTSASLVFMLITGGLYFYSYSYKRQFLIGNVVVALLAGLVPVMPLYLAALCQPATWNSLPWMPILIAFSGFSFLSTLIRELIKDLQDIKGDQMLRCKTIPIVLGVFSAKLIVVGLIAVLFGAVAKMQAAWWFAGDKTIFYSFAILVQIPALMLIGLILKSKSTEEFAKASNLSKLLMLGGILSMVAFRTLIK